MSAFVTALLLVPRNAAVALLLAYRAVISPLYGDVCRYYPSCSRYALEAVQHRGLVIGVALAAKRLARCHPWAAGGVDDVPLHDHEHTRVTRSGFVVELSHGKGWSLHMDIIGTVLWPLKWVVELILVAFHTLFTWIGLDPAAGITWVLSIVGLVLVVRAALIPIFVRQIKSQRRMMEVAPQLKKIQDKYKGKKDQFSREAMSRETMELYKRTGTNPLASCLPLLIQMPIFFSLYSVLSNAQQSKAGVGLMNDELAQEFGNATLFGVAPLHQSIQGAIASDPVQIAVVVIAATMVILMTASQFFTQLQIMSKNQSPEAKASPMYRQQRILLYILPLVFAFSGWAFPLGVMFYWLTSNGWTLVQQYLVIRNMPTPGSEAAKAREARLAKRGKVDPSLTPKKVGEIDEAPPAPKVTQRQQPVSKQRAKKQGGNR